MTWDQNFTAEKPYPFFSNPSLTFPTEVLNILFFMFTCSKCVGTLNIFLIFTDITDISRCHFRNKAVP